MIQNDSATNIPSLFTAKYIHFVKVEDKPKTSVFSCRNNSGDYQIGIVKWNPGWRQYCFFPEPDMVFSVGCLDDIGKFIRTLMAMRP